MFIDFFGQNIWTFRARSLFFLLNKNKWHISCSLSALILNYYKKKLAQKKPYITSIRKIKLKLSKLQKNNLKTKKLKKNLPKQWKNIKDIYHYQNFPYIPEIIFSKVISYHYNNLLADYFRIEKTQELIAKKYFCLIFC